MRRLPTLLSLVALLTLCVAVTTAVPVGVEVTDPGGVSPGGEATITYEITNTGEEPTAALGIDFTPPAEASVTSIDADRGIVTEEQHSVFWIEQLEAGETVTVTFALAVDDEVSAGEYGYEARIHTSDTSTTESGALVVTTGEDEQTGDSDGDESSDDSTADPAGGTESLLDALPTSPKGLVVGAVVALAVLYLAFEAVTSALGRGRTEDAGSGAREAPPESGARPGGPRERTDAHRGGRREAEQAEQRGGRRQVSPGQRRPPGEARGQADPDTRPGDDQSGERSR